MRMRMTEITEHILLPDGNIDRQNYTASILQLCMTVGIISSARAEEIRCRFDTEFKETAAQYTSRESSSISMKLAEQLYSSLLYRTDIYLLSLKSDEAAVLALKSMPIGEILNEGRELILRIHEQNLKIFRQAYKKRLSVPLAEYRYVMDTAFDEYVRNYSARFDARNCGTSIDYPLLGRPAYALTSEGAVFINEYYTSIMLENELCSHFAAEELERLLLCYGRLFNVHYSTLLFNIAEVVMNNLLACLLLSKPLFCISLTRAELDELSERYSCYTYSELTELLTRLFDVYREPLGYPQLFAYAQCCIQIFSRVLYGQIKQGRIVLPVE